MAFLEIMVSTTLVLTALVLVRQRTQRVQVVTVAKQLSEVSAKQKDIEARLATLVESSLHHKDAQSESLIRQRKLWYGLKRLGTQLQDTYGKLTILEEADADTEEEPMNNSPVLELSSPFEISEQSTPRHLDVEENIPPPPELIHSSLMIQLPSTDHVETLTVAEQA